MRDDRPGSDRDRRRRPCPYGGHNCGGPDAFDGCQSPLTCPSGRGPSETARRLREETADAREALAAPMREAGLLTEHEDGAWVAYTLDAMAAAIGWTMVEITYVAALWDEAGLEERLDEAYGPAWRCSGMGC